MSERRALLDSEMYKISEEDSQDEEVLASYTEDALKIGQDVPNGNPRNSRVSWNVGGGGRHSRHFDEEEDPLGGSWEYSSSGGGHLSSSSQFNPSKLRLVHGLPGGRNSHHRHHKNISGVGGTPAVRIVNTNNSEDQCDNSVDWPETSTNSDSCLSGEDPERIGGRRGHHHQSSTSTTTSAVTSAVNNNKFVGRTYFGDHIRNRNDSEHPSGDSGVVRGGRCSTSSVYLEHPPPPPQFPPQPQGRSRQYQKRSSRRRHARNARGEELSTSGSECSDEEDGSRSGSSSSSSSSSPCADCLRGTGSNHHHHHHRHRHHSGGRRNNATSSSEVEEYDSSYSDSSYGEDDEDRENEEDDDYDEYYDDDDEGNECFDDIVKFLSDTEIESITNVDGDLFLVEYSADESEERVNLLGGKSDGRFNPDLVQNPRKISDNESNQSITGAIVTDTSPATRRNSQEGSEADKLSTSSPSGVPTAGLYQKSSSGKGAKGRISRLLKRKRDPAASGPSKTAPVETTSTAQPSSATAPEVAPVATPSTSSFPPTPPLPTGSPGKKPKGNSSIPTTTTSGAPEKVFRFKDEHGGETRTVFVDIPQAARTGNLLGRRATLIESILGIIPDHFSTPISSTTSDHPPQPPIIGSNDRIMVAGFVPDGVASKYRRIKIGDWLQSVDDIPVDHGNVDQVLNSRSMYGKRRTAFETEYLRLKLTLRRVAGCMVSLPLSSISPQGDLESQESSPHSTCPITSITEPCWSTVSPQVQANVAILFISSGISSTNSAIDEESSGKSQTAAGKEKSKDVVYSWPMESESKMVKALAASQGMFSTLFRLLWDVTGSHPVVSKVVIDDCEMDVTYTSDDPGKSLLLIGVATSLSTFTVHHQSQQSEGQKGKGDKTGASSSTGVTGNGTGAGGSETGKKKEKKIRWREPQAGGVTVSTRLLTRVENLLKYQFGSFASAFKESNVDKVNRLLTNSLSALNDLSEDFLFLQVPGNFLRFPNCIRSGIDDVLYSFETSDALNFRRSSSSSSRRRSKDSYNLPVYHCHGSCLMYKGFLISSHLENELASSFHGWWRTQLGLWQGIKRNAILDKWKPVSRLALWQETCLVKKSSASSPKSVPTTEEGDVGADPDILANNNDTGDLGSPEASSSSSSPRVVKCFSGLVGIGNFTLGFVLEHLTDFPGSVGPDADWLRRAMTTICRLYQSGLSQSFECWFDEKQGGREEYIELCGTSSVFSSKRHIPPPNQQEKLGSGGGGPGSSSSRSATLSLKRTPATGSILKNTTESSSPSLHSPSPSCPIHSPQTAVINTNMVGCTCNQANSSPALKGFVSTSTFGGGIRSGITGGISLDDFSSMNQRSTSGGGDQATGGFDSDGGGDDMDADDTTTGTGSDNSSFKWYERAASETNTSGSSQVTGDVKHIRVTRGNLLLDYMQVEFGRGVMLASKDIHEGWAACVRHNFRQSATVIHHILHKAANARQRLEERGQDKKWVSLALAPISEHGILFHCQITDPRDVHKKKPRKRDISYWVVGRIYPDEREIYVCYEDGPLSQNLVEIAYKIALNVHC